MQTVQILCLTQLVKGPVNQIYHHPMVRNTSANNVDANPCVIISLLMSLLPRASYDFEGKPQNPEHVHFMG